MSISFRRSIRNRFRATAQYTLARTISSTNHAEIGAGFPFTLPANNYDLGPELGRADFDRRHRFAMTGILDLPLEFRMGAIFAADSGAPYNIITGFDDNRDTVANDRPPGVTRNTGQGPGFAQLDLRLTKLFRVPRIMSRNPDRRPQSLEINMDVFNVFNRTNYGSYIGQLSSPFFGRATSAKQPRLIQFSAKYVF